MSATPDSTGLAERLRRLEEAQAFAEHADDRFVDHLRALERRVMETAKRLEALELRLGMLGETLERITPPEGGTGRGDPC